MGGCGQSNRPTLNPANGEVEVIALALVLASLPQTQTDKYVDCLKSRVAEFEVSGESSSNVARAAIYACAGLENSGPIDLMDRLRGSFENHLILRIVRLRACRKTTGCKVASLPDKL
jgi:hypothetical protein